MKSKKDNSIRANFYDCNIAIKDLEKYQEKKEKKRKKFLGIF